MPLNNNQLGQQNQTHDGVSQRSILSLPVNLLISFGDLIIECSISAFQLLTFRKKSQKQDPTKILSSNKPLTNQVYKPLQNPPVLASGLQSQLPPPKKQNPNTKQNHTNPGDGEVILERVSDLITRLESKENYFQQKIKHATRLNQITMMSLVFLLTVNTPIFFFNNTLNSSANSANLNNTSESSGFQNLVNDKIRSGTIVVDSFHGEKAVVEVGSSLTLEKSKISLKNGNCKTPIVPPNENGCSFVIVPKNLGIPKKGIIFKSIKVEATIPGEGKFMIYKKNYEKGKIVEEIGAIKATNLNKKILLPESISGVEGLELKFWQDTDPLEIRKIVLEYSNVEDLTEVSGKIAGWKPDGKSLASIYQDVNESKKFDPKIDKPWPCRGIFPGTQPVKIDADGSFIIYRDSQCYTDTSSDAWFSDDNKKALPPGDWLLVLDDSDQAYNFNIPKEKSEVVLDLYPQEESI